MPAAPAAIRDGRIHMRKRCSRGVASNRRSGSSAAAPAVSARTGDGPLPATISRNSRGSVDPCASRYTAISLSRQMAAFDASRTTPITVRGPGPLLRGQRLAERRLARPEPSRQALADDDRGRTAADVVGVEPTPRDDVIPSASK